MRNRLCILDTSNFARIPLRPDTTNHNPNPNCNTLDPNLDPNPNTNPTEITPGEVVFGRSCPISTEGVA